MMGRQTELLYDSSKTHKVNVQDVKIMYPVDDLIKCLPVEIAFRPAAKYHAHPKHLEDMSWS